ncbi:MAG: hypothetical protein ABF449_13725 [Ethanoligenens sp.]
MKMRKICFNKWMALFFSSAIFLAGFASPHVEAATLRGQVSLSLETQTVSINVGSQKTVTATASPDSVQLLNGCGCNGTCGEDICTDPSQGCVCYGTTGAKQTSYAAISPLSDNTQVATAKYSNGAITIYALAPGTAHVSVTGRLNKYSDSATQTISVTVYKSGTSSKPDSTSPSGSTEGGAGTSTAGPTGNSSASTGGVSTANVSPSTGGTVSKASGSSASGTASTASSPASSTTSSSTSSVTSSASSASIALAVESAVTSGSQDAATVELTSGPTGKTALMDIQGQDKSVVFEKKDGDKLLYFWTFNGKNITAPADIDMSLTASASSPIGKLLGIKGKALYLDFTHSGTLPGKATVSVNVGDTYKDGDTIYAYYYDPSSKKAELIEKDITVKDGFASFNITHCSTYFFTSSPLPAVASGRSVSGSPVVPIIVVVLASLAALAFLYWFFWARKGGKPAELLALLTGRFNRT